MSFCMGHYSVKKEQTNNSPEGAFFVISTFLPIAIIFGEKNKTTWLEKHIKQSEKWTIGTNEPENDRSKLFSKYST